MSKPKLIWKYFNDLPNLRRSLGEAHIDVLTAGIPRHLRRILCSVGVMARPGSTMPGCALLWIQAQEGKTIRARRHRHLPRPNEDAGVRQGVITLVRIDEHYECDGYHDACSDDEHLMGGRPSVYARKHLTRKRYASAECRGKHSAITSQWNLWFRRVARPQSWVTLHRRKRSARQCRAGSRSGSARRQRSVRTMPQRASAQVESRFSSACDLPLGCRP